MAYDPRGEAASYDLYVREHESGTYGSDPLQTRGAYEAGLQAQVVAAEQAQSAEIGGREAVVFLAPMGAHHAIGFEAWQAVAQWAVVTDDAGVVQAVRDDTPAGDPEHTETLANLTNRITTAAAADGQAANRATTVSGLQQEYRDLGAYGDITPGDGQTTTFTPARPPAAPTTLQAGTPTATSVALTWDAVTRCRRIGSTAYCCMRPAMPWAFEAAAIPRFSDSAMIAEVTERNCSPHPMDVLAMYALYQSR